MLYSMDGVDRIPLSLLWLLQHQRWYMSSSSFVYFNFVQSKKSKFRKHIFHPQFLPFQLTVISASLHETNLWKFYKGYKVSNGTLISVACGREDNTLHCSCTARLWILCYFGDWVSPVKGKVVLIWPPSYPKWYQNKWFYQECSCGPLPLPNEISELFSSHCQQRESEQSGREIRHQRMKD